MAIQSLIAAGTAAADAALTTTDDVQLIATKLGKEEYVFVHIYGLAGDTEHMGVVLSREKNTAILPGPSKYHVYKEATAVSLGVGYHILTVA